MTEPASDPRSSPRGSALVARIWRRDPGAFVGDDAPVDVLAEVQDRLGFLDAPSGIAAQIAELEAFAAEVRADGLTDVVLIGMGGSSLCAEVLRDVPDKRPSRCRLIVLDTTELSPDQVAQRALELARERGLER